MRLDLGLEFRFGLCLNLCLRLGFGFGPGFGVWILSLVFRIVFWFGGLNLELCYEVWVLVTGFDL